MKVYVFVSLSRYRNFDGCVLRIERTDRSTFVEIYIVSTAIWLGGTVNNANSAGSRMSVSLSLKKVIIILEGG